MKRLGHLLSALCGLALMAGPVAAAPKVLVSIKPIHSLVAGVMQGVGLPELLIEGGGSPHAYSLRPSEARLLERADAIFWIGAGMETFLEKPLAALSRGARLVALADAPGVVLLPARAGGTWEAHEDEPADQRAPPGHDAARPEDRPAHREANLHIWLDPHNAEAMTRAIAATLAEVDPANAARYAANGEAVVAGLAALDRELRDKLAAVKQRPYVVFHDAYPYFEARYGTNALGAIAVSPERAPGAKRISEIRGKIRALGAICVFSEPQFTPALVQTLVEGTDARIGVLDPLGAALVPGPGAYAALLRAIADSLAACLEPTS